MRPDDVETTVAIRRRLRPLRLAFLVEPTKRSQVLRAIEACTTRWGGVANPIIPVYRRSPRWMRAERGGSGLTITDITRAWLDTFEPDYLIECAPGLSDGLGYDSRLVTDIASVEKSEFGEGIGYGVSVADVYRRAYEKEYRFEQRHANTVWLPEPAHERDKAWHAVLFGRFPEAGAQASAKGIFKRSLDAKDISVGPSNFTEAFLRRRRLVTPITATSWDLKPRPAVRQLALFVLFDPSSVADLTHMWNLRALGFRVWPVPLPCAAAFAEALETAALDGPLRHIELRGPAVVSPAPTMTKGAAEQFGRTIQRPATDHPLLQSPTIAATLPLWNPNELRRRRLARVELTWQESETEATSRDGGIRFDTPAPDFLSDSWERGDSDMWASVVTLRDSRISSDLAEVFPPDLQDVGRLLSAVPGRFPITAGTDGIVVRCNWLDTRQYWGVPTGTDVFLAWLRQHGINGRVSSAGLTLSELLRALGGPLLASQIAYPSLIREIGQAVHGPGDTGVIPYDQLRRLLIQIHKGDHQRAEGHARVLTERVLQVQLQIRCPHCDQRNWYPPDLLGEELPCSRCLRAFPFPADQPPQRKDWGYKPRGAFAVPNYAQGSFAVALALRFFTASGLTTSASSWSVSVEDADENGGFEADFGAWIRTGPLRDGAPELLFGEAKTFNRFQAADFARARNLLSRFPQARFVFATLNEELTSNERDAVIRLARRRVRGNPQPYRGRVVVLTAAELCTDKPFGFPYMWRDLGGRFEEAFTRYRTARFNLDLLSDATLDVHTGWTWEPVAAGSTAQIGAGAAAYDPQGI